MCVAMMGGESEREGERGVFERGWDGDGKVESRSGVLWGRGLTVWVVWGGGR